MLSSLGDVELRRFCGRGGASSSSDEATAAARAMLGRRVSVILDNIRDEGDHHAALSLSHALCSAKEYPAPRDLARMLAHAATLPSSPDSEDMSPRSQRRKRHRGRSTKNIDLSSSGDIDSDGRAPTIALLVHTKKFVDHVLGMHGPAPFSKAFFDDQVESGPRTGFWNVVKTVCDHYHKCGELSEARCALVLDIICTVVEEDYKYLADRDALSTILIKSMEGRHPSAFIHDRRADALYCILTFCTFTSAPDLRTLGHRLLNLLVMHCHASRNLSSETRFDISRLADDVRVGMKQFDWAIRRRFYEELCSGIFKAHLAENEIGSLSFIGDCISVPMPFLSRQLSVDKVREVYLSMDPTQKLEFLPVDKAEVLVGLVVFVVDGVMKAHGGGVELRKQLSDVASTFGTKIVEACDSQTRSGRRASGWRDDAGADGQALRKRVDMSLYLSAMRLGWCGADGGCNVEVLEGHDNGSSCWVQPWPSSRSLDFSLCFEDGVLFPILNIIASISMITWLSRHVATNTPQTSVRALAWLKVALITAMIAVHITLAVQSQRSVSSLLSHISTAGLLLPLLVAAHLIEETRLGGAVSPTTAVIWFASTMMQSIRSRTELLIRLDGSDGTSDDNADFIGQMILFALSWSVLVIHFLTAGRDGTGYYPVGDELENPRPPSSMYSNLTFGYMWRIMLEGTKRSVTKDDLWDLQPEMSSESLFQVFERRYRPGHGGADGNKPHSLWPFIWSLLPFFGTPYLIALVFLSGSIFIEFVQPILLDRILDFISATADDQRFPPSYGWTVVSLMALVAIASPPVKEQFFHRMLCIGIKIRTGVVGAIYQKALRISSSARQKYTQGQIQTLQSVDAEVLQMLGRHSVIGVRAPIQLALVFYFLYLQLGWAFLPGLAVVIFSTPVQVSLTNLSGSFEKSRLKAMDSRIKWMGEAIKGMLVVKLNTWEEPMLKTIKALRLAELSAIRSSIFYQALAATVWQLQPNLVAIACFGTYVAFSAEPLTPAKAFVSLALMRLMSAPVNWLRNLFIFSKKFMISARRIDEFLRAEEVDVSGASHRHHQSSASSGGDAIVVTNGEFAWSRGGQVAVRIPSLRIKKGDLCAIVGRTGQGKSSIIAALLGEMFIDSSKTSSGSVDIYGSTAYASQQAWIVSGTVRDNIVFGRQWDPAWYERVVEACALRKDFELWAGADLTEIGERGINLSGGQKQRVALARAVYANADVYFLDDPLSAVDMHVDSHIFKNVIGDSGLLARKTRIFVTNGLHHLPSVPKILFIKGGEVFESGNYRSLVSQGGEFAAMAEIMASDDDRMRRSTSGTALSSMVKSEQLGRKATPLNVIEAPNGLLRVPRTAKTAAAPPSLATSPARIPKHDSKPAVAAAAAGALTTEEDQGEGSAGFKSYKQYAVAFSIAGLAVCSVLAIASSAFSAASAWWLGVWSSADGTDQSVGIMYTVYVGIVFAYAVSGALVTYLFRAVYAMRAATVLHDSILDSIMHAPMSFFDITPSGRILNRFSKDMETVCDALPTSFLDTLTEAVTVISGIVVCTIATPLYILMVLPLLYPYIWLQRHYLGASRDLRRLHSVTRSPIYQILSESLDGLTSIRAYGAQERFLEILIDAVNLNNNAWESQLATNRWFDVRIDTVGLFAMVLSAALCVASRGHIAPEMAGLAITYATSTAGYLSFCVQDFCVLEVNIVAVERISEYADCPKEAPRRLMDPPYDWPSAGQLTLDKFSARYRPGLDLVLKDVTFKINPRERIGIVGRTGSGKSSLVLGLTRIVEAAGGQVSLDGVDLAKLGLFDVRKNITVIPQEPVLFATSLRENLDPFFEHSDEEIWRSLERAHMKAWASTLPGRLETPITEGGGNLSVGERQLLCMAKAILRRARVLILDEATSSIDIRTDELIQKMLREEFRESTVLCIAHRINTILDYDRILVMDSGRVVEFESPAVLLDRPESLFSGLCRQYQTNVSGLI